MVQEYGWMEAPWLLKDVGITHYVSKETVLDDAYIDAVGQWGINVDLTDFPQTKVWSIIQFSEAGFGCRTRMSA